MNQLQCLHATVIKSFTPKILFNERKNQISTTRGLCLLTFKVSYSLTILGWRSWAKILASLCRFCRQYSSLILRVSTILIATYEIKEHNGFIQTWLDACAAIILQFYLIQTFFEKRMLWTNICPWLEILGVLLRHIYGKAWSI